MNMTDLELNQFKEIADKSFQAELLCALVEDHPHQLTETQVSALASLIKKLAGDIYACAEHAANDSLIIATGAQSTPLFAPYTAGLSVGDHIQLARENLGLSEAELARLLDTHSDNISDWECGITEPPAGMVIPLANALKCDPMWLLGAEVNRQPPATPAHQSQCQHSAQQRSDASDHASHHERNPSQA